MTPSDCFAPGFKFPPSSLSLAAAATGPGGRAWPGVEIGVVLGDVCPFATAPPTLEKAGIRALNYLFHVVIVIFNTDIYFR